MDDKRSVRVKTAGNTFAMLIIIGFVAGIVLIIPLKIVLLATGNTAYVLLFNFDYIPVINKLRPIWLFGYLFHFVTCIVSVVSLFYILRTWRLHRAVLPYVLVYTLGGGALFFLTALSDLPPSYTDFMAWLYWTIAHGIFGLTVGILVRRLISLSA